MAAEKDRRGQCMCAVADFDKYLYFGKDVEVPKSMEGHSRRSQEMYNLLMLSLSLNFTIMSSNSTIRSISQKAS